MYGLSFDEDENDLTEMNPEKMELAYVVPGKKTAIAASSAGGLWGGYAVPEAVVAETNGKEEDRAKQAKVWTDEPPPGTTAGQLMCPAMGISVTRGYVLGCRDL